MSSSTVATPPYRTVNPATGHVTREFPAATDAEVREAIEAAHGAFDAWRAVSVDERAAVIARVADLLDERADELATLAAQEMGKALPQGVGEVAFSAKIARYFAEYGPGLTVDTPLLTFSGANAVMQKRPLGALLGIMPWNFPYYQVVRFAAPNLVLGNTILLKHAESIPQCALAIEQIFLDAGAPRGAFQNVFATHDQIASIVADDRVQGVSLTGSERAGAIVGALAGQHLKKCVLELGGSDPYIVLAVDDVEAAADAAWQTRMYNAGQACNSNKRMIVADHLFTPFVERLTALAAAMTPADPLNFTPGTSYAPLSSRAAAERLAEQVEDAVLKGATLHAGGVLGDAPAAYYSPTVLSGVTPDMRAFHEELFGPVAVVYRVDGEDDAVRLANGSAYGLGGSVFSTDPEQAARVAERLDVGMTNVNTFGGEGPEIPFGGIKRSGFGRELGPLAMDEFVNKRLFYVG
jgi:succinate-semialdehyde dehydrogenase / glutarate-semialdehyde dehydrogenase